MLESQKLALRASEIRVKLAELAGAEGDLGDEAKAEVSTLRTEYQDVEVRFQAASTSEDVKETNVTGSPEAPSTGRWLTRPSWARSTRPPSSIGIPMAPRPNYRPT